MAGLRRGLLLLGATLTLQAFVLYRAFHGGVLSGLVPWDDCLVILRALSNLNVLSNAASLFDLAGLIGALVIHSPVSDIPTLLGLMFTGGGVWGAFALNGIPVALALYAVVVRAGPMSAGLAAALAACLLLQPMTINALVFLKADWKSGVLTAAAVYVLYEAARRGDRSLKLWGAGLLGLAVAAKLTAFYMPVFALGLLAVFELLAFAARRTAGEGDFPAWWSQERPTVSLMVALALGPYLAFFILGALGHHRLVAYIAFALGSSWDDGLTLGQRAALYGPFAGNAAWGRLDWQFLVFAGSALAASAARRSGFYPLALLALLGLALIFLSPLVAARTSNPEFGAMFMGLVLGAVLVSIPVFAASVPRFGSAAALVLALALGATSPLGSPIFTSKDAPSAEELRGLAATYGRIVDIIIARNPDRPPQVRVFYEHQFAPFPNLATLYFQRTGELMDVDRVDTLTPAAASDGLGNTDFVLTIAPGRLPVRGVEQRFATSVDPGGAERLIAADPRFSRLAVFPITDGEIRLYQARATAAAQLGVAASRLAGLR